MVYIVILPERSSFCTRLAGELVIHHPGEKTQNGFTTGNKKVEAVFWLPLFTNGNTFLYIQPASGVFWQVI
jgi:hypothetical protein